VLEGLTGLPRIRPLLAPPAHFAHLDPKTVALIFYSVESCRMVSVYFGTIRPRNSIISHKREESLITENPGSQRPKSTKRQTIMQTERVQAI
jgi:hypothetical protein